MTTPSIAALLSLSGYTNFTPALVSRAINSLYGNIGAGLDERNWDLIMSAPNPLLASEAALAVMYQDSSYLQRNVAQLTGKGYAASQAELTYRQIYGRLDLKYAPGWAAGTSYENLGKLSDVDLLAQAQADVAAQKPVAIEAPVVKKDPVPEATPDAAPTITLVPGNSGLGVTLNVQASLALSVGGALGSFATGTSVLADQSSVKSGTMTATGNAGLTSSATSQTITLGTAGNDTIDASGAGSRVDHIAGGAGNDAIIGGAGDDVLMGGAGNDTLTGSAGADTLYGGDGDDSFIYAASNDLFSGPLVDSIDGGAGVNAIALNSQNVSFQIVASQSWASRITNVSKIVAAGDTGGQINIALHDNAFEAGLRIIDVSADTNTAVNANFIDVSAETGSANGYVLTGHIGVDYLTGGAGNDTITGGAGADSLLGGDGDDVFIVNATSDAGSDTVTGGNGTDVIRYTQINTTYTISANVNVDEVRMVSADGLTVGTSVGDLNATAVSSAVNINLYGNDGYNVLQGNGGNNRISSGAGSDMVYGWAGNDTLIGGSGNDTLRGGAGTDSLTGTAGNDTLTGDADSDTFNFAASAAANGLDSFTDFTAGAGGDVWNFGAFLPGASYGGYYSTAAVIDLNINNKLLGLRAAESAIDEATEVASFINGANNAFSISAGGKGIIITSVTAVTPGGSDDYCRIFYIQDANSNAVVDAGEIVLVGITQADFDLANLVSGNFSFAA